ncbi:oxidoreductase, partial [Paenibacillus riograndensis]
MAKVRYGIIGIGNMGRAHALSLLDDVKRAELAAVCDISPERLEWASEQLPEKVKHFRTAAEMFQSGTIDAVLISTPHYDHPPLAIEALGYGLHVLIEKPAGVYTKAVQE